MVFKFLSKINYYNTPIILIVIIPLLLVITYTFIFPRDYFYCQITDIENDYYYKSKLFKDDMNTNALHPGTPVYLILYLLLSIFGDEINNTQFILNISYIVMGLIMSLSFYYSLKCFLNEKEKIFNCAIFSLYFTWPPFLIYTNYFGSDAFILAAGLPLLTSFFTNIVSIKLNKIVLTGIISGLSLAIKLSFLPLILIMGSIITLILLVEIFEERKGYLSLIYYPISLLASFYLFILPDLWNIPRMIRLVLIRSSNNNGGIIDLLNSLYDLVIDGSFIVTISIILIPIFICYYITSIFQYIKKTKSYTKYFTDKRNRENVINFVFIFLWVPILIYTLGTTYKESFGELSEGANYRYSSTLILPIPFLVINYFNNNGYTIFQYRIKYLIKPISFLLILSVLLYIINYTASRNSWITTSKLNTKKLSSIINELLPTGGNIAYWDGSPGGLIGESGFHYWGNYSYGLEQYNVQLEKYFPSFTQIRFRHLKHILSSKKNLDQKSLYNSRDKKWDFLGEYYWKLKDFRIQFWPLLEKEKIGNLFSQNDIIGELDLIIFPISEFDDEYTLQEIGIEDFVNQLTKYFPKININYLDIAGQKWFIGEVIE